MNIDQPAAARLDIGRYLTDGPGDRPSPCSLLMVPSWLLGIWRLLRADSSLDFAPGVRMEFLRDGRLHYHVDVGGSDQVIALVFRVEGDTLYTDNPAAPHSTAVRMTHGAGDMLLLDFGEASAVFVREI